MKLLRQTEIHWIFFNLPQEYMLEVLSLLSPTRLCENTVFPLVIYDP